MGITQQVKVLLEKLTSMKNGTYLVIEHTEALHVIDVNSGKKVDSNKNQSLSMLVCKYDCG